MAQSVGHRTTAGLSGHGFEHIRYDKICRKPKKIGHGLVLENAPTDGPMYQIKTNLTTNAAKFGF